MHPPTDLHPLELVVLEGPDAGARLLLERRVKVIGRAQDADLPLHDARVSRRHLEIERVDSGVRVRLIEGAKPAIVNGREAADVTVDAGARLVIGRTLLGIFASQRGSRDTANTGGTDARSLVSGVAFDVRAVVGLYDLLEALPGADDLPALTSVLAKWGATHAGVTSVRLLSRSDCDVAPALRRALERARELVVVPSERSVGALVIVPCDRERWVAFELTRAPSRVGDSHRRQLALAAAVVAAPFARLEAAAAAERERGALRELAVGSARTFLGSSDAAVRLAKLIARVAPSDAAVLIEGESGVGKSFVARLLHESGPRARAPFRVINCAAIPEALLESELFGHERGAFTGAVRATEGALAAAGDGTILLDEIGELPLTSQAKLRRVLDERRFERVGSNEPVALKARVLMATSRDLPQMVKEGRFREDLYFRMAVITVPVPPLRERAEDIAALADQFRRDLQANGARQVTGFSADAMRALEHHTWPGNLRELRNVVERALVLGEGRTIEYADVALGDATPRSRPSGDGEVALPVNAAWLENENIDRALRITGGNRARAAAILGIDRSTLFRKRPPE